MCVEGQKEMLGIYMIYVITFENKFVLRESTFKLIIKEMELCEVFIKIPTYWMKVIIIETDQFYGLGL